jgi:hypothetical protein
VRLGLDMCVAFLYEVMGVAETLEEGRDGEVVEGSCCRHVEDRFVMVIVEGYGRLSRCKYVVSNVALEKKSKQ